MLKLVKTMNERSFIVVNVVSSIRSVGISLMDKWLTVMSERCISVKNPRESLYCDVRCFISINIDITPIYVRFILQIIQG